MGVNHVRQVFMRPLYTYAEIGTVGELILRPLVSHAEKGGYVVTACMELRLICERGRDGIATACRVTKGVRWSLAGSIEGHVAPVSQGANVGRISRSAA